MDQDWFEQCNPLDDGYQNNKKKPIKNYCWDMDPYPKAVIIITESV